MGDLRRWPSSPPRAWLISERGMSVSLSLAWSLLLRSSLLLERCSFHRRARPCHGERLDQRTWTPWGLPTEKTGKNRPWIANLTKISFRCAWAAILAARRCFRSARTAAPCRCAPGKITRGPNKTAIASSENRPMKARSHRLGRGKTKNKKPNNLTSSAPGAELPDDRARVFGVFPGPPTPDSSRTRGKPPK